MAITAQPKITKVEFILPEDDQDNPTKWELMPLDGQQYMGVMAEANMDKDDNMTFSESTMKKTLKYGLVGWSNFLDVEGKNVTFSRVNFGRIPVTELTKIFAEIIRISSIDEDEAKNL